MSGLQWKRHLRPVVMPPDDLVLLAENGHRLLQGEAYVRAAPLLDGCFSDDEIHAQLERAGIPELPAWLALSHLRALGLLVESHGEDGAQRAEAAFWESLGEDAAGVTARLRFSRAALRDVGGTGTPALRNALEAAGVVLRDDAERGDLTVVVADDYLDPRLRAENDAALSAGMPWMLVKLAGTVPWIGPLFVPGKTGCWACLAQRLRLNRQTETFVEERLGPSGKAPLPAIPISLALAAEFAAFEVARRLGSDTHEGVEGRVLALDVKTNALTAHLVTRRPQCRACGEPAAPRSARNGRASAAVELPPSPKIAAAGGRSEWPRETLARLERHVSPITGAVRSLSESVENGYLHVAAAQSFPMGRYDFRVLRDNLTGRSGGKGFDPAQARASALCEALERYSGTWQGEEEAVVTASRRELGDDAFEPAVLFGLSARQYAEREAWNQANDEPHTWVPRPFDDELAIDWVPCTSLMRPRTRLVPAAYAYYGHPDMRHQFCSSDSNGCAAGGTLTEAVAHGLLELIERDAAAIWWYNMLQRPAVDLESFALPVMRELRELHGSQNRAFWAIDLTTDVGVPVVAAISARVDGPVEDVIYGFGCDFDPAAALSKALLEMNQSLFAVFATAAGGATRYRTDKPTARRWFETATRAQQPYLVPDPSAAPRTHDAFARFSRTDWRDDLETSVEQLWKAGLETFVLDQTRPDIGLPVCRVVVPGLCHFWRRFGTARLYDAPVRMGWQQSPKTESDLNPWFIYF
jgi:bacteriocin biosynthesis cyclodehydratase domain-containing protein